jgi:hypothetical protein
LQRQRAVIIVGKIGAGTGAMGGFDEVGAFVLAVVKLDVIGVKFGQALEQAGAMAVLGVDLCGARETGLNLWETLTFDSNRGVSVHALFAQALDMSMNFGYLDRFRKRVQKFRKRGHFSLRPFAG